MRTLLIRPPQIRCSNQARRCGTPTGLLSIAAVLRQRWDVHFIDAAAEGYETEIEVAPDLFQFGLTPEQLAQRIRDYDPDVVGVTNTFTEYWGTTYETARLVRSTKPSVTIILGGHHPSGVPSEILNLDTAKAIDFIVIGEAEETAINLLCKLDEGKSDFERVPSLAFRRDDRIVITPLEVARGDLDKLPDPAWDLMDSLLYDYRMSHSGMLRGHNFLDVLFSRGCPIACTFCTSTNYWGAKGRVFFRPRIRSQLAKAFELGWEEMVLEDDNVLTLPRWAQKDIIESLGEFGRPWSLDGGLYYPAITKDFVQWLADSGCYRVFLPVENPDVDIMHTHHKYASIRKPEQRDRKLRDVARWFHDAGIEFYSAIMIGFCGETLASIRNALRFGRFLKEELGAFGCAFHWVHPFPFTAMYTQTYHLVHPERRWQDHPEYYCFAKPVYPIDGMSLEDATKMVDEAFYELSGSRVRDPAFQTWGNATKLAR